MRHKGVRVLWLVAIAILGSFVGDACLASEPSWQWNVIARGAEREKLQNTPIVERPYRPLHFYGNTVRRRHYRGSAVPGPRDVAGATTAVAGIR